MNTGLMKLIEATESVNELSRELAVKEKELYVASMKADKVDKHHTYNTDLLHMLRCAVNLDSSTASASEASVPSTKHGVCLR